MPVPIRIELPSIFQIKSVNSWLIKGPEPVLIDCGEKTDKGLQVLKTRLKEEGLELGDISKIIITHAHLDHIGMAGEIAETYHTPIWLSEYTYDWAVNLKDMLNKRVEALKSAILYVLPPDSPAVKNLGSGFGYETLSPFWGEISPEHIHTFPMDGSIDIGGETWEVIYTPGHCINQTCFYQRDSKQLFSADMLLRNIAPPIIDAEMEAPYARTQSLATHVSSYHKLLELPIDQVYPGHYQGFTDAHAVIHQQLEKIEFRKKQCVELIAEGVHDFQALWKQMYTGRLFPPSFLMVLGVLDMLMAEERVKRVAKTHSIQFFLP